MADYKTALAAAVLNDGKIVSYRLLAREVKVHGNIAKRMLYEFHQQQNKKNPGSVHATYLLDGVPKTVRDSGANVSHEDDEDVPMQSSPYMSSSMPQQEEEESVIPMRSIILAKQEDLEEVKSKYEVIHSIHIYSLGPSSIKNLQILSDCNRTVSTQFLSEDPLVVGKQYGVIQNGEVRRRPSRRPPGVLPNPTTAKPSVKTTTSTKQDVKSADSQIAKASNQPSSKSNERPSQTEARPAAKADQSKPAEKKSGSKPVKLKREQSDIFKSFARKPPAKLKREDTESSAQESAAADSQGQSSIQEDEPMKDPSSEEEDEETFAASNKASSKASSKPQISKSEREEQLRKMMDDEDEDEEMKDAPENPPNPDTQSINPTSTSPPPPQDPSPSPQPTATKTRRRGRRKVMKKKTIKDEEGYLVTKEEPAWESFSEEEPVPTKAKVRTPASSASTTAKGKKGGGGGGGKPGQGSIMSFFGKK